MSCRKPSRALFKAPPATCQSSGSCRPCPLANNYTIKNDDNCCNESDVWQTYTPTITAGGATIQPTVPAASVVRGQYIVTNNTLFLNFFYKHVNGGGVNGNGDEFLISLPLIPGSYLLNNDSYFLPNLVVGTSTLSVQGIPQVFFEGRAQIIELNGVKTLIIRYANAALPIEEFWNTGGNFNMTTTQNYEITATCTIPLK